MERHKIFPLGLTSYRHSYQFQNTIWEHVHAGALDSALILCRHEPVITLGRRASRQNILIDQTALAQKGIVVHQIERGGDVTYHGPGQLTGYPIINLNTSGRDVHAYLRALETIIIQTLAHFGVSAQRQEGSAGVWVGARKIASIGIAIKKWITWHGFSINVRKDDLLNFSCIRPCGQDISMTSMETEAGKPLDLDEVTDMVITICRREMQWPR